jgi:adenylosuccinate lyase
MELNELTAISPVDGRYRSQTAILASYFSELALIRYRVRVEIDYFVALCEWPLPQLKAVEKSKLQALRDVYAHFGESDARQIKEIERVTNHDVKAVEYYLREVFQRLGLEKYSEFIHFGLTSQDINNTAVPLSLKEALHEAYFPVLRELVDKLKFLATQWMDVPMLARTHGQPASPTRVGKEFQVYVSRLENQWNMLKQVPISGKFGGATGNFNAHHVAYPEIDWPHFADLFLQDKLGLVREPTRLKYPITTIWQPCWTA